MIELTQFFTKKGLVCTSGIIKRLHMVHKASAKVMQSEFSDNINIKFGMIPVTLEIYINIGLL
jgi:hypothetical protein